MIVRAVLTNPELIELMDLFNDGRDTINWLRTLVQFSEFIEMDGADPEAIADSIEKRLNEFRRIEAGQ